MEDTWNKACQAYDIPEDVTRRWFQGIKQRLNEKSSYRHYHNWHELLLSKEELLRDCSANIVLASFFQYYCFDGKQPCVKQNCLAFEEFCQDANWKDVESKAIIHALLGDKSITSVRCCDEEANKLQDMDLMILGSSPEKYKRYAGLLRLEYSHMSDAEYKQMRLKVLQALLMIPNIFATNEFQKKYEQLARTNIEQEIKELKE